MAKAPAENHFYNSLRLNDGGLGADDSQMSPTDGVDGSSAGT